MREFFERGVKSLGGNVERWHDTDETEGAYLDDHTQGAWEVLKAGLEGTGVMVWEKAEQEEEAVSFALHCYSVNPMVTTIGQLLNALFSSEESLNKVAAALQEPTG